MDKCMVECMVDMVPTDNLGGDNKHKYNKPLQKKQQKENNKKVKNKNKKNKPKQVNKKHKFNHLLLQQMNHSEEADKCKKIQPPKDNNSGQEEEEFMVLVHTVQDTLVIWDGEVMEPL